MLQMMVRQMCEEAGIEGHKTNHNLRVSSTSCLFSAGVPERVVLSSHELVTVPWKH